MAGQVLDDILTGLAFDGDRCTCRLVDEASGAEFRLWAFGHHVPRAGRLHARRSGAGP